MNRKGQALVEFVLILPILIIILFAIIDFGRVYGVSNELQTKLGLVVTAKSNEINIDKINSIINDNGDDSIVVKINPIDEKRVKIILEKEVKLFTPLANTVVNNPYVVVASLVVNYE